MNLPAALLLRTADPTLTLGPRRAETLRPRDSAPSLPTRRKIWDLGMSLHCSVIGTCLATAELRAALRKCGAVVDDAMSEHDLHTVAVSAAGKREQAARHIHKALDRRHRLAINQAAKAKSVTELRLYWHEAMQRGEIPGAYWAVLTHPATDDAMVRQVFGDVHMLSHLVGAANRADIRRLRQLEADKAVLEEKLARQERQLRDAVITRDATIRDLGAMLSSRIETASAVPAPSGVESAVLDRLVADLNKALAHETRRRERAEAKCADLLAAHAQNDRRRQTLERDVASLEGELAGAEERLAAAIEGEVPAPAVDLRGAAVLYIGGPPHHIPQLRWVVERAQGRFIHHDGGIEEALDLLAGLAHRADLVVFPVDCVSHAAVLAVKRLCRQSGKRFVPLRSTGIASLLRALGEVTLSPSHDPT
jgi:hypothetical protein